MPQGYLAVIFIFILLATAWGIFCAVREKRLVGQQVPRGRIVYDGQCPFCRRSVERLKAMDRYGALDLVDLHTCRDIKSVHPDLTKELAMSQIHFVGSDGILYGGFRVFQRLCLMLPALYVFLPIVYFPGMRVFGPFIYRAIAQKRYSLHRDRCGKK